MNTSKLLPIILASGLFLGCGGDDPEPSLSQNSATMLAGQAGKTKSWRLLSITEQVEIADPTPITIEPCVLDNIYTFTNNSDQSYEATEGATSCVSDHPNQVEAGTWAFTSDGKQVMILSTTIRPSNPGNLFSYYGFAFPGEVIELSENAFKLRMTFIREQGVASLTIYYVFTFTKA